MATNQYSQTFAGMFGVPDEDTPAPVDPRTAAEDRVRGMYDAMSDFERATMRWLLGVSGWTDAKALDVRQRTWRRAA